MGKQYVSLLPPGGLDGAAASGRSLPLSDPMGFRLDEVLGLVGWVLTTFTAGSSGV